MIEQQEESLPSWRLLQLPDVLAQHVLSFLPENTVPYAVRLTCKDAAASFESLQHKTLHVGPKHPPIPAGALLARWGPPGSTCSLTCSQRYKLLSAAARAGDIPTMQLLLTSTGCVLNLNTISKAAESRQPALAAWLLQHEDCPITRRTRPHDLKEATVDLMKVAVSSGSVDTCKVMHGELLKLTGAGFDPAKHEGVAVAAARSGSPAVCTWLRRLLGLAYNQGNRPSSDKIDSSSNTRSAPGGGSGGGAVAAAEEEQLPKGVCKWEWALEQVAHDNVEMDPEDFLSAAAHDCDLTALQRVYDKYVYGSRWHPDTGSTSGGGAGHRLDSEDDEDGDDDDRSDWSDVVARAFVLLAALCSPTPDWEAKARWLLAKGYPWKLFGTCKLASCSCAVERLEWMRANGVTLKDEEEEQELAHLAAAYGNVPLLRYLLDKGVMGRAGGKAGESDGLSGIDSSGEGGDGGSWDGSSDSGSWHTDVAGGEGGGWDGYEKESDWDEEDDPVRETFAEAAQEGHLEVLQLLVGLGYALRPSIVSAAAGSGKVEVVEWCLQQLCGGEVAGDEGGDGTGSREGDANGAATVSNGEAAGAGGSALGASSLAGAVPSDGQQQQQQEDRRRRESQQGERERRLLGPAVMEEAARSGSTALVQWLHVRGCAWDEAALGAAAMHGSEELVEWMTARGCAMPVSVACSMGHCIQLCRTRWNWGFVWCTWHGMVGHHGRRAPCVCVHAGNLDRGTVSIALHRAIQGHWHAGRGALQGVRAAEPYSTQSRALQ